MRTSQTSLLGFSTEPPGAPNIGQRLAVQHPTQTCWVLNVLNIQIRCRLIYFVHCTDAIETLPKGLCSHSIFFVWAPVSFFSRLFPTRRQHMWQQAAAKRKSSATSVYFSEHSAFFVRPLRALWVENIWTLYKSTGVVTVALFQATNHMLDGAQLLICHPGNHENGGKETMTEKKKNICRSRPAGHWTLLVNGVLLSDLKCNAVKYLLEARMKIIEKQKQSPQEHH